jgi:hypothetical protein
MKGHRNKLFILGNGFDLAHDLNTSYTDFINNFWNNEKENVICKLKNTGDERFFYSDDYFSISCSFNFTKQNDYINLKEKGINWIKALLNIHKRNSSIDIDIHFKNSFLEQITKKALNNWVDLEVEYYNGIIEIYKHEVKSEKKENILIKKYNFDFSKIKTLLEEYLTNEIKSNTIKIKPRILNILKHIITPENYNEPNNHTDDVFMFLTFNYTHTEQRYIKYFKNKIMQEIRSINIHGELNNSKNNIIFGYGDELDANHKEIKNYNINDYLENNKTIKYFETANYKGLLNFINLCAFDVYIIGHSCGISDRTLLNTIFEHDKCKSIKIFYYKREDSSDDFQDIVMNVYRNFTDDQLMRDIVSDRTSCEIFSIAKINKEKCN